ncbi:hypothetical protein [Streptomyces sp. AC154]|uniref:hypothetical protein n=1 Tax=Streptomyces sp. AC154 TaxID=3143184 RepID=UPI003F80F670
MYTGLVLTVIATAAPYADRATTHLLADHIRDGYPTYSQARVDSAGSTYLVLLSVIGALGVLAWIGAARSVGAGRWWARPAATALFALGAGAGLTGLLTTDTSGAAGLPPALGWAGMPPAWRAPWQSPCCGGNGDRHEARHTAFDTDPADTHGRDAAETAPTRCPMGTHGLPTQIDEAIDFVVRNSRRLIQHQSSAVDIPPARQVATEDRDRSMARCVHMGHLVRLSA